MKMLSLCRVAGCGLGVACAGLGCAALVGADFDNKVLCSDDCPDSSAESDSASDGGSDGFDLEAGPGHYVAAPGGDDADADEGNPNSVPPPSPALVSNATSISIGDGAACTVLSAGTVTCWGNN